MFRNFFRYRVGAPLPGGDGVVAGWSTLATIAVLLAKTYGRFLSMRILSGFGTFDRSLSECSMEVRPWPEWPGRCEWARILSGAGAHTVAKTATWGPR